MALKGSYDARVVEEYLSIHSSIEADIEERMAEFRSIWERGSPEELLMELFFCILTPQSNAHRCWDIVVDLKRKGDMFDIGQEELADRLGRGARFKNNKARHLLAAREMFRGDKDLRETLMKFRTACDAREWIVKNVKGIGYKEASHFLRNIGWGSDMAILDRHILRNLVRSGVLGELPKSVGPATYCRIEQEMKRFSESIGIPLDHLDFVMWYREKGEIFK